MSDFQTPVRGSKRIQEIVKIPASPLLKQIGFGTGVAVYELKRSPICNKFRSPWALKKLVQENKNKELAKRLQEEAAVLKQLKHPNIVGFRAFVKGSDGRSILAMEECSTCLGDLIETRLDDNSGPFPPEAILKVCKDVAAALDYLHNHALLLHCDVKSYNVLIKGDFLICKLCDFGVTLPLKPNGEVDSAKAGPEVEFVGTPAWSAPEILQYPQIITTKADIYAFGLVIWEMIALVPPVDEEFAASVDSFLDSSVEVISRRKRPDLPEDVELGVEYNFVLEIHFCCTIDEMEKRPTAKNLKTIFEAINKK